MRAPNASVMLATAALLMAGSVRGDDRPPKIAIIKADDVRKETRNWQRFFELSKEKGAKVSAGIICDSLEGAAGTYSAWLKGHEESGWVEFWNHGWDHKRWETPEKKKLSEFSGSGYAHQKKHYSDAQAIMKRVLGTSPIAFGTPFNAFDADTAKVLDEDPSMRLFFCNPGLKPLNHQTLVPMMLRGEHDGTGKPNFAKFRDDYRKMGNLSVSAIQFHPSGFTPDHLTEYSKILDFLISEGWTFMPPSEYVALAARPADPTAHEKLRPHTPKH